MRVLLGSFFLIAALVAAPQTSRDLHSRYGEPDMERFVVRPGIGLTVEYGSDGLPCRMEIEGQKILTEKDQSPKEMSPDVVTGILDEAVPLSDRGIFLGTMIEAMGCSEDRISEYEHVSISRSTDNCLPLKPERERNARIIFKRQACRANSAAVLRD